MKNIKDSFVRLRQALTGGLTETQIARIVASDGPIVKGHLPKVLAQAETPEECDLVIEITSYPCFVTDTEMQQLKQKALQKKRELQAENAKYYATLAA